jgi:hypothetical protein
VLNIEICTDSTCAQDGIQGKTLHGKQPVVAFPPPVRVASFLGTRPYLKLTRPFRTGKRPRRRWRFTGSSGACPVCFCLSSHKGLTALPAHRKLTQGGRSSRLRGSRQRLVAAGRCGAVLRQAGTGILAWVASFRLGEVLVAADRFLAPWGMHAHVLCADALCWA